MRLPKSFCRLVGLLGACAWDKYSATLDARYHVAEADVDPKGDWVCQPMIYAFWHEYLLLPVGFFGHCRMVSLTSQHRDAEIATHLAEFMGFRIFRGSRSRGGTEALRRLLAMGQEGYHLTMMPDGPKGPRRKMSLGTIFLASRLGFPIIPTGIGVDRPWRFHSWDRFAVPRPFSRVRILGKEKIWIPPHLKRSELEEFQHLVEERLQAATREAEEWAASGVRLAGEQVLDHRPRRLKKYRVRQKGNRASGRTDVP
ncbi:MAG: lysophospholipid acyltransferase family protein [Planctomycetia bacterium]|nr:lysophospholipid acyltransferase family protein [Planctomycetia bacterium]MDO5113697.1 lysophospholipid acyltransferase family protein [Planctomycetia bacterium]